jgi:hypothetical protein
VESASAENPPEASASHSEEPPTQAS